MLDAQLREACAPRQLRRLAGERSYERGEEYRAMGLVSGVVVSETTATATVAGGERYRVRLTLDGSRLAGACSCPMGAEGAFCKHCVATALAVYEQGGSDAMREYLVARPHGELVDLLLEALARDDVLRDRIRLSMDGSVEALVGAIDDAAVAPEFVTWSEAWAHAERLDGVLSAIERHGDPAVVVELAERFVRVVDAERGNVDDSAGVVSGTIERALQLHLAACEAALPDPVALAEWLFELELHSDMLDHAVTRYSGVLGDAGRARFREVAEAAWADAPAKASWTLARIMERLAEGDVDRLVAIKARSLEHGWDYLEIARLLHDAGRVDEALGWAERGVGRKPDVQLRDFLADTYTALGRHQDALDQRVAHFAEWPSLRAYQALHAAAEPLGRWPELRAAAHTNLASPLRVSILLWEGDVPGAWEQALAGGCAREHWRALARSRPADAAAVYRRLLAPTIKLTNDGAYHEAVDLLAELHALLAAHGREAEHAALVAEIRQLHRRKRNLIKLLDAKEWACP